MSKNKTVFSKCTTCPLYDQKYVFAEASHENLDDIKILILAEAPSHEEIKDGIPLSPNGNAGSVFRAAFSESKINSIGYMISNVVLCSNITNKKTNNPPQKAIDICSDNWKNLINIVKPEIIILLGKTARDAVLGSTDVSLTNSRNNTFNYHGIDCFVTYHPSYVHRNGGTKSEQYKEFLNDFINIKNHYENKHKNLSELIEDFTEVIEDDDSKPIDIQVVDECHKFKLPDWCYSENVLLFDIQNDRINGNIHFIFKTKNGKNKYLTMSNKHTYYYIQNEDIQNAKYIEEVKNTKLVLDRKYKLQDGTATFEKDLRLELKHSIDYRLRRTIEEPVIPLDILYWDIEIYTGDYSGFPAPSLAKWMINAISFKLNDGQTQVYIAKHIDMDNKKIKVNDKYKYTIFPNEQTMLVAFCNFIAENKIDIMSGWNSTSFDVPYFFNRLDKLKIPYDKISPFKKVHKGKQEDSTFVDCFGIYFVDQMWLYKKLVPNEEASYKLSYITTKNLDHTKVAYEGTLNNLYKTDLSTFIEYSCVDTELLWELETKLSHISTQFELVRICSSTWKAAETSLGKCDPLIVSFTKKKNLVCKSRVKIEEIDIKISGAYVFDPKPGLYKWIVDFDFTSLYPSIIRSANIGPDTFVAKFMDKRPKDIIENNSIMPNVYNFIYKRDECINDTFEIILDPLFPGKSKIVEMNFKEFTEFLKDNDGIITSNGCIFKSQEKHKSLIAEVLEELMNLRKVYKNKMKDALAANDRVMYKNYDCVQNAYKILSNSLYGALLSKYFRFFNTDLGLSITTTGKELINFSAYHLGNYLENDSTDIDSDFLSKVEGGNRPYIVYGDTDSLLVSIGDNLLEKNKIK